MQSQLFPPEIIENTTESYLPSVSIRSQLIYIIVLVAIIGTFAATPFIFVDVSVQSDGIIRTVADKTEIHSLVPGLIADVKAKENTLIVQGQPLFVLKTDVLDTKIRLNSHQQNENGN
jgi:multidrug resistance efflux pump